MLKNQSLSALDIKILLLKKNKMQIDLFPLLYKKYPKMKLSTAHLSMALNDKYPPMLDRIREVIDEL